MCGDVTFCVLTIMNLMDGNGDHGLFQSHSHGGRIRSVEAEFNHLEAEFNHSVFHSLEVIKMWELSTDIDQISISNISGNR